VISISSNTDDIRNHLDIRLGRDAEPEAMSKYLPANIVRIVFRKSI